MKTVTLTVVVTVVAAVAVAGSLLLASSADPSLLGGGGSSSPHPWWSTGFNGCCFDDGIRNADTIPMPTVHTGTSTLYLVGSLSIASWTRFNGTGNDTGTCDSATTPAGACDVYIGIWTPDGWSSYAAGGPMQPSWCYSAGGGSCTAVSNVTFTSSNLTSLEGLAWELVVWNVQPYGLIGSYTFSLYVSPDYWSS